MYHAVPYVAYVHQCLALSSVNSSLKTYLFKFSNRCKSNRMVKWFCSPPVSACANALNRQYPKPLTIQHRLYNHSEKIFWYIIRSIHK